MTGHIQCPQNPQFASILCSRHDRLKHNCSIAAEAYHNCSWPNPHTISVIRIGNQIDCLLALKCGYPVFLSSIKNAFQLVIGKINLVVSRKIVVIKCIRQNLTNFQFISYRRIIDPLRLKTFMKLNNRSAKIFLIFTKWGAFIVYSIKNIEFFDNCINRCEKSVFTADFYEAYRNLPNIKISVLISPI